MLKASQSFETTVKALSESTHYETLSKRALKKASEHPLGSSEYHRWMSVHHKAASIQDNSETPVLHEKMAEMHADHAGDDADAFHNGDSHHWHGF